MTNWLKFAVQQLVSFLATVAGVVILIPPCLLKAWTPSAKSIDPDRRVIDVWSWRFLNASYGNPEDGVSGAQAIVNGRPYMPGVWAPWRAYCWSAWRNAADALKYRFAAPAPDYRTGTFKLPNFWPFNGTQLRWIAGWKDVAGIAVSTLSLGKDPYV